MNANEFMSVEFAYADGEVNTHICQEHQSIANLVSYNSTNDGLISITIKFHNA